MTVRAARRALDVCERFDASVFEELFIVAGVTFEEADGLAVEVVPAEGEKCLRCWNYREPGRQPERPACLRALRRRARRDRLRRAGRPGAEAARSPKPREARP